MDSEVSVERPLNRASKVALICGAGVTTLVFYFFALTSIFILLIVVGFEFLLAVGLTRFGLTTIMIQPMSLHLALIGMIGGCFWKHWDKCAGRPTGRCMPGDVGRSRPGKASQRGPPETEDHAPVPAGDDDDVAMDCGPVKDGGMDPREQPALPCEEVTLCQYPGLTRLGVSSWAGYSRSKTRVC
jgi:hypothetical protein